MAREGSTRNRPDEVTRAIDRERRLRQLENRTNIDPTPYVSVRFYADMILQWLYRGAGGFHPEIGHRAGGAYLYENELGGVALNATLRNRIRDLRAEIGVAPHLVRRRRSTDAAWELSTSVNPTPQMLLETAYDLPGGLEPVGAEDPYAVVQTEDGPIPETWVLVSHAGVAAESQPVVWAIKLPAGQSSDPAGVEAFKQSEVRWTSSMDRQRTEQTIEGSLGTTTNPYGEVDVGVGSSRTTPQELITGLWGFNVRWRSPTALGGSEVDQTEQPWNASADSWITTHMFDFPFRHMKDPAARESYEADNLSVVYTWVSELSPVFETVVLGDYYFGMEADLLDAYTDAGEFIHGNWPDPESSGAQINALSYTRPALATVRDLLDEYLPQYQDVFWWCIQRFQEWEGGNSSRTYRRENKWAHMSLLTSWSGTAQYLKRDGWVYLRGRIFWSDVDEESNYAPWEPDVSAVIYSFPSVSSDEEVEILGPSFELTGLVGVIFGGEQPDAVTRFFFDQVTESGEQFMRLIANIDYPDRRGVHLDGLAWQHADPATE